jgi:hypothetical protein
VNGSGRSGQSGGEQTVPYVCPFCGEEDLRPAEGSRWHCCSCLRLFTVTFHGLSRAGQSCPEPASAVPPPTPASGIRPDDLAADRNHDRPAPHAPLDDDPTSPRSSR